MSDTLDDVDISKLPKISFAFPVLNEELDLARCLRSIRNQKYPTDKLEIVIADGGSTDRTLEIASEFNCIVIKNPLIRAEPGAVLAHKASTGSIKVYFAADNELPHRDWVLSMVRPFLKDPEVYAAFPHILINKADKSLNKYYSFLHVDPFTWYVYGNAANPINFLKSFKENKVDEYNVYEFKPVDHPLLALAQGFCIRSTFQRDLYNNEDDILPIIEIIAEEKKIAYVPSAGIYHFHLRGLLDFIRKYNWRIQNSLTKSDVGYSSRNQYQSLKRKIRKYTWLIYGFTILPATVQSLFWSLKERNLFPLWHAPICFLLCMLIILNVFRQFIKRILV